MLVVGRWFFPPWVFQRLLHSHDLDLLQSGSFSFGVYHSPNPDISHYLWPDWLDVARAIFRFRWTRPSVASKRRWRLVHFIPRVQRGCGLGGPGGGAAVWRAAV